ncbi:MAG TPA: hypothetical protein VNK67_10300 [Burkholderiales bacterium]|nr:hypothetical protein [Burkholderiales bacterium]
MEKPCEQLLLARGAKAEVVYCRRCRVFHVNVDALTVHFEADALRDLRDTVSAALAASERLAPGEPPGAHAPRARVKLMH